MYVVGAYALSLAAAIYASTQTFAISRMAISGRLRALWLIITFGSGIIEILHGGTTVYLAVIPDNSEFTSSAIMLLAAGSIFACMSVLMRQSVNSALQIPLLERLAYYDALTEVGNRRSFDQAIDVATRNGPVAVILIDIDQFRKINDTYGHDVGDIILKHVARVIERFSSGYKVYRLGGEEFGLFASVGLEEAVNIADACRSAIERIPLIRVGKSLSATISVGVSRQEPGETISSLLRRADTALYAAKRGGRNRVVESTGSDDPAVTTALVTSQSMVSRRSSRR